MSYFKKLAQKNKWLLLISGVLITTVTILLLKDKGVTYELPEISADQYEERKINNYLGEEKEWFLYTPDRVPLYVKEVGQGETIVTLHGGFGMTHDYFRDFMKPFEDRFHIVYFDQRGSMRSPVPNYNFKKYITLDNLVNDLELLRRALKVDKLNLVAHSMGAVLAYEYMAKFPERVGDLTIISGFAPKFPETNAEFHDMFTSQAEREQFANRRAVQDEFEKIKQAVDKHSAEYTFLNYKINSARLQIYDINKWPNTGCGVNFFNPKMNQLIGPESHIPWSYMLKFYRKEKQFKKGKLDTSSQRKFKAPINYLPVIESHPGQINYLMGTHEVGDWNLRSYKRSVAPLKNTQLHIFNNAGHNIWIDQPQAFQEKLSAILLADDV